MKYIYFWGHTNRNKDEVGKQCFSQWYPAPFEVDGDRFLTSEHWMMAQKALLFDDQEIYDKILEAPSPKYVKGLGRQVRGFKQDIWEENRYRIVCEGNFYKFSQNLELKWFLLGTGKRVIVEASPVDKIWGIGLAEKDRKIHDVNQWDGLNLLGFALMEVRDQLTEQV